MSEPAHPIDIPVELQIGLDLLASKLRRFGGVGRALAPPTLLEHAEARLTSSVAGFETRRVLWLPGPGEEDGRAGLDALGGGGAIGLLAATSWDTSRSPLGRSGLAEAALRAGGLTLEGRWGLGRASTPVWAALIAAAGQGTRPDLVDRFVFRYRRSFAPREGILGARLVALIGTRS